jgi:hypothetical protein
MVTGCPGGQLRCVQLSTPQAKLFKSYATPPSRHCRWGQVDRAPNCNGAVKWRHSCFWLNLCTGHYSTLPVCAERARVCVCGGGGGALTVWLGASVPNKHCTQLGRNRVSKALECGASPPLQPDRSMKILQADDCTYLSCAPCLLCIQELGVQSWPTWGCDD